MDRRLAGPMMVWSARRPHISLRFLDNWVIKLLAGKNHLVLNSLPIYKYTICIIYISCTLALYTNISYIAARTLRNDGYQHQVYFPNYVPPYLWYRLSCFVVPCGAIILLDFKSFNLLYQCLHILLFLDLFILNISSSSGRPWCPPLICKVIGFSEVLGVMDVHHQYMYSMYMNVYVYNLYPVLK